MELSKAIAIDGPAASGKSTVGALLAEALDYLFFDTGVMYRALTLAVVRRGLDLEAEAEIGTLAAAVRIDVRESSDDDGRACDVLLDGEDVTWDIRSEAVNARVSPVSAYPAVRKALTEQQRRIARENNVVMVGRDIGTVVVPDAALKVFLDASVEVRAQRRFQELVDRGEDTDFVTVLQSLKNRDQIDSGRDIAPLRPAEDAVVINVDCLGIQEVLDKVKALVNDV
jgi:cytidylate kinase